MSGSSDRAKCNQLQEIDLDTGEKGWKERGRRRRAVRLHALRRTVHHRQDADGGPLPVRHGVRRHQRRQAVRQEEVRRRLLPRRVRRRREADPVASCGAGGDKEHDEVQELDPTTGKAKWTQPFDKGWRVARVYSVDPLVVYSTNEDKKAWNISTFTAGGKFRSQVGVDEDFAPECGWAILERDLQGCQGVAVDANTLYLPTEATTGANEIVAINLANGKEKWRVKSPRTSR